MLNMKRILSLAVFLFATTVAMVAQIDFKVSYNRVSPTELDVVFSGTAEPGWHIYSTNLPEDGPNPAEFGLDKIEGAELVGNLKPGAGAKTQYDPMFEMDITFFENKCTFTQRIKLTAENYAVKGYLTYSACNDQNCLPPTSVEFDLKGADGPKAATAVKETPAAEKKSAEKAPVVVDAMKLVPAQPVADSAVAEVPATEATAEKNAVSDW